MLTLIAREETYSRHIGNVTFQNSLTIGQPISVSECKRATQFEFDLHLAIFHISNDDKIVLGGGIEFSIRSDIKSLDLIEKNEIKMGSYRKTYIFIGKRLAFESGAINHDAFDFGVGAVCLEASLIIDSRVENAA